MHETSSLLEDRVVRRHPLLLAAFVVGGLLTTLVQADARENQLAGIKLGRPAEQVTQLYGDPTRTFTGVPSGGAGAGGGMMGGPGSPEMGGGMPGSPASGPMGGPGMGMGPGMMGGAPGMEGGMGMGAATPSTALARQKFEGKIAAMKPEDFVGLLLAPPAAAGGAAPGAMGMGMGPGMMGGPPGMEGGMGMPGMPGGMGMPGMSGGAPGAGQAAAPPAITWIYERPGDFVTYVFGFSDPDDGGRVNLVIVGDDKPYSTNRGGRRAPFGGVKTAKGVGLGDTFKNVIIAYGFPESTEIAGDEVLLKYFERHGVAFTFRQNFMRVTSIAIKSPEE